MVVWRRHRKDPQPPISSTCSTSSGIAAEQLTVEHYVDDNAEHPDHFHAHARPWVGSSDTGPKG
jgi:hypothetical protein